MKTKESARTRQTTDRINNDVSRRRKEDKKLLW